MCMHTTEKRRFDRQLERTFQELPIDPIEVRLGRLAALCNSFGIPVHLPHGLIVPDPEISLRLLDRAADRIEAIDWLSTRLTVDELYGCWSLPLPQEHDSKGRARYPTITSKKLEAKGELAHRLVVRRIFGALATEQHLDHICRTHACCNPTHLDIVTHTTNVRRGAVARRAVNGQERLY